MKALLVIDNNFLDIVWNIIYICQSYKYYSAYTLIDVFILICFYIFLMVEKFSLFTAFLRRTYRYNR